jgi:hypothetical protein
MSIKIPYMRKDTSSTLLVLSAAIVILPLASPIVISNFLVQPVQATNTSGPTSVQTDSPLDLGKYCNIGTAALAFEAQGTPSSSDPTSTILTNGTFQITNGTSGQTLLSGHFFRGSITDDPRSAGWDVEIWYRVDGTGSVCGVLTELDIATSCPGGDNTPVDLSSTGRKLETIYGTVDCDTGGNTTVQYSSSSMTATTTSQDSDGDGIPDSSDRCTHNSNQRCYEESK